MDDLIKRKLDNAIVNEAEKIVDENKLLKLETKELADKLNDLDDLSILRRVLENYEQLKPMIKEYFEKKDREKNKNTQER